MIKTNKKWIDLFQKKIGPALWGFHIKKRLKYHKFVDNYTYSCSINNIRVLVVANMIRKRTIKIRKC